MELNRNPENYFAEGEQAAFSPSNIVRGIGFSPDKVLQARIFSYAVAHRYRMGTHYEALPVNAPKCPVHDYHKNGPMRFFEPRHPVLHISFGSGNFKEPGPARTHPMAQLDAVERQAGVASATWPAPGICF